MEFHRREFLRIGAGALAGSTLAGSAWAQGYPANPVRLVVGFPAGSSADLVARLMGQSLSERLGRPFVIDNKTGLAGNIATESVVTSKPDGYTLLWILSANAISTSFYSHLRFNFLKDIEPIAAVMSTPLVMTVKPSFPAKTVPEFIAYAKANPGKINMASGGIGGTSHVTGELFKMKTGINMLHVPYRGDAPAMTDLIGGRVDVIFGYLPLTIEYVKSGQVRALAVTTAKRSAELPDVPTVGEFVPGFEAMLWHGVGAPKNVPAEIAEVLHKNVNLALADPAMKKRLSAIGSTPMPMTRAEFAKFVAQDSEKWGEVVKFAGIKGD
ncbi:MAG: Bug family tripartite tricarboxylate transporter substrate binding protein [Pseudolabrys sp.]